MGSLNATTFSMRGAMFLLFAACQGGNPWEELDARYTRIEVASATADRDTTRQIHSKEARQRKVKAAKDAVAFFQDPEVGKLIAEGQKAPAGSPERLKADLYMRRSLTERPWSKEEKAEETRLVAALEEIASEEGTWFSADGALKVDLGSDWGDVSKEADKLDEATRAGLAEAWADHRLRALGPDLQALVKLRNEVAKREGFPNYWELSLARQGLTPKDVEALVAELTPVVKPTFQKIEERVSAQATAAGVEDTFSNRPMLRRLAGVERGRDEVERYTDADNAEDVIRSAFGDMGIATSGWQFYTGPRRYVQAGVYGFAIRPPEVVAIVMSQDERYSFWPFEALGHEAGHGVWWGALPPDAVGSPVFWQPSEPWFEGFAQFFERLVFEPTFVEKYLPEVPAAERDGLARWRARHVAEAIGDSIVCTQVERRLYEDPSDLSALTRYAGELRSALTGQPAALITDKGFAWEPSLVSSLLWSYPAYDQNYLYAYATEATLHELVRAKVGEPVGNPKVGPLLAKELVQALMTTPFPDRLLALGKVDRAEALSRYLLQADWPAVVAAEPTTVDAAGAVEAGR